MNSKLFYMFSTTNTILITGGSSGIGLEMSKRFLERGDTVIICGRSEEKLKEAKLLHPSLIARVCDVADPSDCQKLTDWIWREHPQLNMLINNAAIVSRIDFFDDGRSLDQCETEMQTNFMAPLRLIKMLYPLIRKNPNAAIINITTGLVYAPRATYPFYNATKAAFHSFTQVLRLWLKESPVAVTEVFFPVVATPWHQGDAPKIAITPQRAVDELFRGLQKRRPEIRIGKVKLLYRLSRIAPALALKVINSVAEN